MVISEHQFHMLAERYKLSPTQRVMVRYVLSGVCEDRDLAPIMGVRPLTLRVQFDRIFRKMHVRSRIGVLYEFVAEAKLISP